MFDLFSVIN